jgi:hypothetical protein
MIGRREDPFEPHHPELALLRAALWLAVILFAACLAINATSLFGYDLTQLTHFQESGERVDPEWPFLLPIAAAVVLLFIPVLFHQGWNRERLLQDSRAVPSWMKLATGAIWLYLLATMIYMAIVSHGGGPVIHNGVEVIWWKGEGKYEHVSPEVYHRAVAVTMLFISAWGMMAFGGFVMMYWGWLQNASPRTGWSRTASDRQ